MEVIPLDDRIRSTTVLNSTNTASDAPDFNATVYHDDDDASALPNDNGEDPAAGGGLWTRKNKLILTLVATSALLCAVATGGGIAAHRARVNANRCFDDANFPPVGAAPAPGGKSSKSPSTKSSKSPSTKSSKAPGVNTSAPTPPLRKLAGATVAATVDADELYDQEEEDMLRKAGLTATYPIIPKTVEDRRKNRMLAQHLGQPEASNSWVRRLQTASPGAKSSKSPSTKSSKSPSTKSSKAPTSSSLADGAQLDCKCPPALLGAAASSSGTKSSKSPSTKSSKSPSTKSSKSPGSTKSPSTKSSKSPSTKSSKAPGAAPLASGMRPAASPITCQVPVSITRPRPPTPVNGGGSFVSKSSKAPSSSNPGPITPVRPVPPPSPPATTAPPREEPVVPEPVREPVVPVVPPPTSPVSTPVDPPCEEGDDCDGVPPPVEEIVPPVPTPPVEEIVPPVPTPPVPTPPVEEIVPPVPTPPVPTPPVEEVVPPVPTPPVEEIVPPVPTPPVPTPPVEEIVPPVPTPPVDEIVPPVPTPPINCENDADWITDSGDTCATIAEAEDSASLCATAVDDEGTTASEACPAVCNEECIVNCDNDGDWSSTAGADCVAVASNPDTLCSAENADGVSASEACPASCNEECIVTLNCDNDASWISTTTGNDCAAVKDDPKALCREVNDVGVSASDACPASCNVECFPEPPLVPLIPIPVPSPSTTTKPSVAVTATVGTPENKNTYTPTRGFQFLTPLPTELVTNVGSGGATITVSTETTGPPTAEVRDGERM